MKVHYSIKMDPEALERDKYDETRQRSEQRK